MGNTLIKCLLVAIASSVYVKTEAMDNPTENTPIIKVDGLEFADLNRNGRLDRYEDYRLDMEERLTDLVNKMTEKVF